MDIIKDKWRKMTEAWSGGRGKNGGKGLKETTQIT